ncbi:MAG: S16 family serine protease [Nitriliruptoraceae bacterium]
MHIVSEDPPGTAWRLNGRLIVEGQAIDPPGRWSWLAVGRPAFVGELALDAVFGREVDATDMREESTTLRPALAEPAAAAVGLRHAGRHIPLGLLVEAYGPLHEGLPDRAIITQLQGIPLQDRAAWELATGSLDSLDPVDAAAGDEALAVGAPPTLSFETLGGAAFTVEREGEGLPYRVVRTLDTAPQGLDARISFQLAEFLPVDWFRDLSLGSSHGLMVALTTYAHVSGSDLAGGRHIAGTGGIRGDGSVVPIGGLAAKAEAAERAGADVLFYPATQTARLAGADTGDMTLVPVSSLAEAIEWLTGPTA